MLKALRLAICLIVGLAVPMSGCGSAKTASTPTRATASNTASTSAGATAPAGNGGPTATQGTGAKHVPQTAAAKAKPEGREKAAEAKPEREQKASKRRAEAVKPGVESAEQIPRSHRYPRTFQLSWIVSCEAAKGSNSSCECILRKLEKSNVERGQSMAELFALELELKHGVSLQKAMHHGVELPRRVQRDVEECGRHS